MVIIARQGHALPRCNVFALAAFPLFASQRETAPMPTDSKIDPGGEKIRKGEMSGRMRYVLLISLSVAIVAMLGIYFYFAQTR